MALKDLGYSNICCRCGFAAVMPTKRTIPGSLVGVQEFRISLDGNCRIVRCLCEGCIANFEFMYREWWERK